MGHAMQGDKDSPEEDHAGHVFCDWEVLESKCVGELRNQETQVEKGLEVIELIIVEAIVCEETEDSSSPNGVFVQELHCVVIEIKTGAGK